MREDDVLHLYTARGRVGELSGDYAGALANYAEMTGLAQRRNEPRLELAALMAVATIRSTPTPVFDTQEAQALCDRGLALAASWATGPPRPKILWILLLLNYFAAEPTASVAYGERSIALARELGLTEQLAFALNDIHRSYLAMGDVHAATAAREEAETLWRELGNLPMLADNLNGGAEIRMLVGDYEGALALTAESEGITGPIGNSWQQSAGRMTSRPDRTWTGAMLPRESPMPEAAMRLAESSGFAIPSFYMRVVLAGIFAELGAFDRAEELSRQALDFPATKYLVGRYFIVAASALVSLEHDDLLAADAALHEVGPMPHFDWSLVAAAASGAPMIWLARAALKLRQGEPAAALSIMEELLAGLRTFQLRPTLPDALYLKARALRDLGRPEESRLSLEDARRG